jgi:drug/metabolite transporter (DMT)-like permease
VIYDLLLMRSYGAGEFNQVYPLARGTSPLVVTGAAALVASEHLEASQLAGVAVVSVGLALLAGRPRHGQAAAVGLALATGLAIASYTVVDGVGVRHADSPLGYSIWLFAWQGPLVALVARRSLPCATPHLWLGTLTAALSLVAYGLVIWAQRHGELGPIAALRETSVVAAALIGALVFKERLGARRIAASVVVVAGVALLNS